MMYSYIGDKSVDINRKFETVSGAILPLAEHNCLKYSLDKFETHMTCLVGREVCNGSF